MHSRGFVVAGAMKNGLLEDLRKGVDEALVKGTTLEDFRKTFDQAVKKYGWSYNGERGWRTGVIFNTNMRTAYAAGRYEQMTDPAVLADRPFWKYISGEHFGSADPRPEHKAWDGVTLPWNDAWWQTHEPPNGWGCKCEIISLTANEAKKEEKTSAPQDETYPWKNPSTGEIIDVPKGIDPGWAYSPGRTAWGDNFIETNKDEWKRITKGDWKSEGRPQNIRVDIPVASVDFKIEESKEGMQAALQSILNGPQKGFSFQSGEFRYDVMVNAEKLINKPIPVDRAKYIPLLPEAITDPYEVWLMFEQNARTGKVRLRQRIIKAIKLDKNKSVLVVTDAEEGFMQTISFFATENVKYVNKQRAGKLIFSKD
jgi:hypothetical protein